MQLAATGVACKVPVSRSPLPFSEADLSRLWQDQTFPPEALTTAEGERLRVVYRGRRTGGPGPDFRDALIAAPVGLLRGEVELHVRSSDFRRHGHDRDTSYAGVILHLVFRDDDRCTPPLPGGGQAPVVALEGWVEGRAREIQRWLERPAHWREPCFSAITRMGGGAVAATFDRLGDMRFRARIAYFARRPAAEPPDEALWRALIGALGFGGGPATYHSVAMGVSWAGLRRAMLAVPVSARAATAYELLMAAAGPLPARREHALRPANRPENRLQGASVLAARFAGGGPLASLAGALDSQPTSQSRALSAAITMLSVPRHIGRSRAVELLGNAVLPCLAALDPDGRSRRAEALYAHLSLPARYGAVRHLHEATTAVRADFRRQQGMLYLLKRYCTQGGCGRCPLS